MKSKQLVFATHNSNKVSEVRDLLKNRFDILSLDDISIREEIKETGITFIENAAIKANFVRDNYQLNCFADDSGLEVAALNGAPGVYSARYAGEPCDYQKNNHLLLKNLLQQKNRSARFITIIALRLEDNLHFFEGSVEGKICEEPRGNTGFGYDPLFIPDGFTKTFAEMSAEEKNKISHRSRAVNKLVDFLKKIA
jgi:XTP/dITP diphosphohydrolase